MWQAGMNQKVEPLLLSLQKVRHHLNNWVSELKNSSLSCRPSCCEARGYSGTGGSFKYSVATTYFLRINLKLNIRELPLPWQL